MVSGPIVKLGGLLQTWYCKFGQRYIGSRMTHGKVDMSLVLFVVFHVDVETCEPCDLNIMWG